jgi:hypothetical protein
MDLKTNISEKVGNWILGSKNLTFGINLYQIQINCLSDQNNLIDSRNEKSRFMLSFLRRVIVIR